MAYLPYLVLAVRASGEDGVGVAGADRRRRRFRLERIDAVNPLTGETKPMLTPGAAMVQMATLPVTAQGVRRRPTAWPHRWPNTTTCSLSNF